MDSPLMRAILHKYNRYQATEYNTAVARARTGKQWQQFNDPESVRLFPYIEWLPSRSATPREFHRVFWNCRFPKNDNFWKKNQPGTLWNCKCDWVETDEEPDLEKNKEALRKADEIEQIAKESHRSNPLKQPGLDQHPSISGQIFTDTAPYIRKAPEEVENYALNVSRTHNLAWALDNLRENPVINENFDHPINFTGKGLRDFINQPMDEPFLKNELIRMMPKLLEGAQYKGYSEFKSSNSIRCSHIFEITIIKRKYWIIVREYTNNDVAFYSISNSPDVLKGIKK